MNSAVYYQIFFPDEDRPRDIKLTGYTLDSNTDTVNSNTVTQRNVRVK